MRYKKISALILSLLLVVSLGTTAFAATSTTATVPVTLTVSNEYRSVNVTVPAALPVYVINGTVVVADNAKIINNSKTSAIQVTNVSVTDGAYKVGSYDNFSGSKTIALKINGCTTKGSGALDHQGRGQYQPYKRGISCHQGRSQPAPDLLRQNLR